MRPPVILYDTIVEKVTTISDVVITETVNQFLGTEDGFYVTTEDGSLVYLNIIIS